MVVRIIHNSLELPITVHDTKNKSAAAVARTSSGSTSFRQSNYKHSNDFQKENYSNHSVTTRPYHRRYRVHFEDSSETPTRQELPSRTDATVHDDDEFDRFHDEFFRQLRHERRQELLHLQNLPQDKPGRRVCFAEKLVSDVWERPKTLPEEKAALFYSTHEIREFRNDYCRQIRQEARQDEMHLSNLFIAMATTDFSWIRKMFTFCIAETTAVLVSYGTSFLMDHTFCSKKCESLPLWEDNEYTIE